MNFQTVGPGTNIYEAVGTGDVSLSSIVDSGIMDGSSLFENTGGNGSIPDV